MLWSVQPSNPQGPRPKSVTRRTVLARRDALSPAERAAASAAIATRATHRLPDGIVALYAPKGTEVDTAMLDAELRERGTTIAYPRVLDGQFLLEFRIATIDELVAGGRFGLREPRPDADLVDVLQIAAFVVPGLAFDRDGGRVGWGRGYYDATLAAAPDALRIGLAFECQLLDHVPAEPHDVKLHHVITELASYP